MTALRLATLTLVGLLTGVPLVLVATLVHGPAAGVLAGAACYWVVERAVTMATTTTGAN
jgi:hypothetical protein